MLSYELHVVISRVCVNVTSHETVMKVFYDSSPLFKVSPLQSKGRSEVIHDSLVLSFSTFDSFSPLANDGEASFDLTGSDLSQVGAVCSFTLTVTDENELQHSVTFDIEASSDETFSVGISTTIDTLAADRTDT